MLKFGGGGLKVYRMNVFLSLKKVCNYDGHHWNPTWGKRMGKIVAFCENQSNAKVTVCV